jgi:hypothetical protein
MRDIRLLTSAALAFALAASAGARAADAQLHAELERIAQRQIFFGHQSVGVNLLEGLAQLAAAERVPVHVADAFIAENGDPLRKLQSFEQAMGQQPKPVEVALMKFCYVDFTAETDASALFARYRATLDRLRAKYPGTIFVHVTAPLTDVQGGLSGCWAARPTGPSRTCAASNTTRCCARPIVGASRSSISPASSPPRRMAAPSPCNGTAAPLRR